MDGAWRIRFVTMLPLGIFVIALLTGGTSTSGTPAVQAAAAVRPGRAYSWLAEFQERYPDRALGSAAHRDAPAHIRDALEAAGAADARLEELRTGQAWLPRVSNVHARIPGVDPTRCVVVAAHHDTVGGAPGAIDDGGAVAVLVELAHVLSSGPPPACDIELVAFDGEESGLVGSKAHVAALGEVARSRVRAALAIELVGWKQDQLVVHTLPYGFAWDAAGIAPSWVPSAVIAAGRGAGVGVSYGDPLLALWYQPTVRLLGLGTGSDAGAYSEQGIPACMLAGSSLTRFYSGYHSHRDTMRLVSSERLDDAARVAAAATWGLADHAVIDSPRGLGDAYLLVGDRTISALWLAILALSVCPPGLLAAAALMSDGGQEAGWVLRAATLATAALGLSGDVTGVLCGVPLVTGAAFAATMRRFRILALLPAAVPLLVQAMVIATASMAFGFRWRGGPLHGALLALLAVSAIGALVLVRLHRPSRERRRADDRNASGLATP